MGRHSPAPDGWISVNRVALDYGLRGNRRLVIELCRIAGIPVRSFGGARCLRVRELGDLLAWVEIWEGRIGLKPGPDRIGERHLARFTWTFAGFGAAVDAAADRLGIPRRISDRVKAAPRAGGKRPVPDIAQIGRVAAGLSLELQDLERRGQTVSGPRRAQIASDLAVLEQAVHQYHCLAAATAAMVDEAAQAFGLGPASRRVRVECDHDPGPETEQPAPPEAVAPSTGRRRARGQDTTHGKSETDD